mmetsp:Transcript_556/g.948  ORF Transcript_556/g.948 Transcript_556/m.948 type:complete len:185 (-) Transcript_556:207-761(-)
MKRLDMAASGAMFLCTALYAVTALSGYLTYGHRVSDSLLGSYPYNAECTIARIGFAFLVSVSYPLLMHAARDACVHFIGYIRMLATGDNSIIADPYSRKSTILFYSVLAALLLLTYGVAMANLDISFLLSLAGALSMSLLTFSVPGLFYFVLLKEEGNTFTRLTCPFMMFMGVFVMILNMIYGF